MSEAFLKKYFTKNIPAASLQAFTKQLGMLLDAGLSLVESLKLLRNSTHHKTFKALLNAILAQLYNGQSFATSLALHADYFDRFYQQLIAAGEQSGTLALMLHKIAEHQQRISHLKRQLQRAWFYPSIVISIAIGVTVIIIAWVIPQFENLLHAFGTKLPYLTYLVIELARGVNHYIGLLCLASTSLIFSALYLYKHNTYLHRCGHKVILKCPWLGILVKQILMARFASVLKVLLSSGIPILKALHISAHTLVNCVYSEAIEDSIQALNSGKKLSQALNSQLFPEQALSMIAIGENSGTLETMLDKIATFYEAKIDAALYKFGMLLEPITMSILGSLIGGLIVAMYLPIFQMGNAIG